MALFTSVIYFLPVVLAFVEIGFWVCLARRSQMQTTLKERQAKLRQFGEG